MFAVGLRQKLLASVVVFHHEFMCWKRPDVCGGIETFFGETFSGVARFRGLEKT